MDCGWTYDTKDVLDGSTDDHWDTLSVQGILGNWPYQSTGNFAHDTCGVSVVQCVELSFRKQIHFSSESIFQYVSRGCYSDGYISTMCRALHAISAENPAHHATLTFRMADNYFGRFFRYLHWRNTHVLLSEKINLNRYEFSQKQ